MIQTNDLIDRRAFSQVRAELGADFVRILGYFREDGEKSVTAIEQAMRDRDSVALILPAHTLKGESRQFGAEPLAALAEHIEQAARRCVETRQTPDELLPAIVGLRPLFDGTLAVFDRETNPLVDRKPVFGRRNAA